MMTSAKERSPASRQGVTKVRQGFSIPPNGKEGGMKSKSYLQRNRGHKRSWLPRAKLTSPKWPSHPPLSPQPWPLCRQSIILGPGLKMQLSPLVLPRQLSYLGASLTQVVFAVRQLRASVSLLQAWPQL
jgi:hypothetical protein